MSVQSWLNRMWYERATPLWWLVPLSMAYGAVSALRRFAYAKRLFRSTRLACPVVVVGNLSVGGTGKTPLVCWLVSNLERRGLKPGIVMRGYGGSSAGVQLIESTDDPGVVGDEALLLARRTRVPVAIGRDRPAAAQLLIERGCGVIVSDDGLQHYALRRDCEIVVIDGDRRFGNGWLLPAGPLRESRARLDTADAVVVNGGRALIDGAFSMRLEANNAAALRGGLTQALRDFAGSRVHAIAGIGHPERFFNMLRAHGIEVRGHALADHARIRREDILFTDRNPVLMTEKDAVKCGGMADERHWCVPVNATFEGSESTAQLDIVMQRIAAFKLPSRGVLRG